MNTTTYYNLKKPTDTDISDIADIGDNMDIIDATMKGLSDGIAGKLSTTGDAADTTIESITESSAANPVPAAGDSMKVLFGKIKKNLADLLAGLAGKLDTSSVYNGLDQTASGYTLDARQGKVLNDGLSTLNDSLEEKTAYSSVSGADAITLDSSQSWAVIDAFAIKKLGAFVVVEGTIISANIGSGVTTLGTIPVGFRPPGYIGSFGAVGGSRDVGVFVRLEVTPTGEIKTYSSTSVSNTLRFSCAYIVVS